MRAQARQAALVGPRRSELAVLEADGRLRLRPRSTPAGSSPSSASRRRASRGSLEELDRPHLGDRRLVRGRCLAYGDGITFWPLVEIVRARRRDHRRRLAGDARAKLAGASSPRREDVVALRRRGGRARRRRASHSTRCSGRRASLLELARARTAARRRLRGRPLGGAHVPRPDRARGEDVGRCTAAPRVHRAPRPARAAAGLEHGRCAAWSALVRSSDDEAALVIEEPAR